VGDDVMPFPEMLMGDDIGGLRVWTCRAHGRPGCAETDGCGHLGRLGGALRARTHGCQHRCL
jgi:hypothetical protein